jgi:molecular chaperone DnaJ
MARRDYYQILGVPRTATQEDIKRAFRQLAREYHPDVNQDPRADERFKEINEAYQVLSDPARRAQYDRGGRVPLGAGPGDPSPFGGTPFEDLFDAFFGGAFGQQRTRAGEPGPERGSDLRVALEVTLEEAAHGAERTLRVEREETCPACFGTGAEKGSTPEPCPTCRGAGQVRYSRRTPFGSFTQITTCPQCGGAARIVRRPCRECRGSGRARLEREITVTVPAGVEDGTRLRLGGEGDAGTRGGERGDLYVDVRVAPHPVFERHGRDLHCEVPISIVQAALGDEIEVPTLDGPAPATVQPGTQPGATLTLRGKGLPGLRGAERGDLVVHVRVVVPETLTREQARLLLDFAKLRGEKVRPARKTLIGKLREHLT